MATPWRRDRVPKKEYPPLEGSIEADVVIVGGGITGILNAYQLAKAGKSVALLESKYLCNYATIETTAFITRAIDTGLSEIATTWGDDAARIIWESGQRAIDEIERVVGDEKIDCEFIRCPAYIYASTKQQFKRIQEEFDAYVRMGFPAELIEKEDLPFPQFGALRLPDQAKFHPVKFAYAVAERAERLGARIFEDSHVVSIEGDGSVMAETPRGEVVADHAVIATYRPIVHKRTHLKKGMYRSYVYEYEIGKGIPEALYFDVSNPYYYFRIDNKGEKDRMIIGGEDHRDEIGGLEKKSYGSLKDYAEKILEGKARTLATCWDGPILEPSDGVALIGEIKPHFFVATAFSGNGMTYSMISALLLRDLILGKPNEWRDVYDPKRPLLSKRTAKKALDYTEEFFGGAIKNLLR